MDFQKRREYFNRCKLEPLLPDDPRYVELDAARRRVRGIDWVDRLAEIVELSDEPVCELFTGLPGSGKSTELIPADAFPWLARVAVDRYLTLETEAQRRSADLMLASNAVLRYLNDEEWFDLHPAVRQIPGVASEIDVLLQSRRT